MTLMHAITRGVAACAIAGCIAIAHADDLRNVKRGDPVPAFRMPAIDGGVIDSEAYKGKTVVLVYISAEQRSSEQAAADSAEVFKKFKDQPVVLVHVTADVVYKPSFEKFRAEREIETAFGLDTGRKLYGDLGMIVFPTTILIDSEGRLRHVLSTRSPDYPWILESYIRHTLGEIDEAQLAERLKTRATVMGSPKSLASRHRAAARLLREKGLFDSARTELVKAREFDPTDTNIMLDLADIDLSTDNAEEARSLATTVLETHAGHRRAQEILGIALFKLDRIDAAREALTESLILNPEPARGLYFLGRIDEMQGRSADALKRYREGLEYMLRH